MSIVSQAEPKRNKRTVVFLGAGASAAEGAPLQNALFQNYFGSIRALGPYAPSTNIDRELATFFSNMFDIDVHRDDLNETIFPTFEEALGVLDLAEIRRESFKDFGLQTSASNSGRIGFIRQYLVLAMAKVIADKLSGSRNLHRTLIRNLASKGLLANTSFVSANYDILIDNALIDYERDDYVLGETINYGIDFTNYEQGLWIKPKPDAIQLLKIHGSLNWLYCATCNDIKITPFEKGVIRLIDSPHEAICKNCKCLMTPVVIPPTFYKNMSNIFVSTVWNRAETALRRADQIIFCGYSFPDADMHIKYLLKRAQINRMTGCRIRFTVINNHPNKKPEQMREEEHRYRRFLRGPIEFTQASFEGFAEAPEQFYQN